MRKSITFTASMVLVPLFVISHPMMSFAATLAPNQYINNDVIHMTNSLNSQDVSIIDTPTNESSFQRVVPAIVQIENEAVEYARNYLGYAYIFGMASPSRGFDCSGLIQHVWKEVYDIDIPHSVYQQAMMSERIPYEEAQEGDWVVYFAKNGTDDFTHIGIYVEEGKVIHASRGRGMVVEENINISQNLRFEIYRLP